MALLGLALLAALALATYDPSDPVFERAPRRQPRGHPRRDGRGAAARRLRARARSCCVGAAAVLGARLVLGRGLPAPTRRASGAARRCCCSRPRRFRRCSSRRFPGCSPASRAARSGAGWPAARASSSAPGARCSCNALLLAIGARRAPPAPRPARCSARRERCSARLAAALAALASAACAARPRSWRAPPAARRSRGARRPAARRQRLHRLARAARAAQPRGGGARASTPS